MAIAGPGDDAGRGQHAPAVSPMQGDVYTMEEAARLKGVSYHTVSRAVRRGKLPTTRLGRMALITQEDLLAWTPMRQRAPKRYRQRDPDPDTQPALLDLASGERVELARRVAAFYQSIHVAAAECDLSTFATIMCDRFARALELHRVSLWEIRQDEGVALRRGAFGPPLSDMPDTIRLTHLPGLDWLRQHDELQIVDALEEIGVQSHVVKARHVGSLVVAPLRVGERLLGSLVGDWLGERQRLSPAKTHLAQIVGNQAALAFDLATRRAAEIERSNQLAAILENVAEGVTAVDAESRLLIVNAAHRDLLGMTDTAALIGQPIIGIAPAVRRFAFDGSPIPRDATPMLRALRGERIRDARYWIERTDGSRIAVNVNAQPIRDGAAIAGAVAVTRDITASRAHEARERTQLQRLETAAAQAKAVAEVSLAVNAGADLRTVLQTAIERLTELLGGQSGSIFFHEAGGQMVGQIGYLMDAPAIESAISNLLALPATLIALGRGEPLVLHYDEASEHEREFFDRYGFRSAVIVPLLTGSEPIGAVYVNYAAGGRGVTEADLAFAATLAAQCAAAIDKARLLARHEAENVWLRAAIERVPQPVILTGVQGDILTINAAARTLFGGGDAAPTALICVADEGGQLELGEQPVDVVLRGGIAIRAQPVTFARPDGDRVSGIFSFDVMRDGRGQIVGALVVADERRQPQSCAPA
ncbi:MAG: GAF domain-containing protein [Thermomicrobiales bacterium]